MALVEHDVYRTPSGSKRTWLARLSPWPELAFYLPVFGIVWRAARVARRGGYTDERWTASSLEVIRAMEGVGMTLTVEGMDQLRGLHGPAVYVGNHMSTLETFALPALLRPLGPVTFVVKQSLLTHPLFGAIMRSRDPIAVGRDNPRRDLTTVINGGKERLGRGTSIIVFPQTTRSEIFDPGRFNTIGAKLAVRAGVAVVPLALDTRAWGNAKRFKEFGPVRPSIPVRFRFGAPIEPEGKGDAAHRRCVSFIEGCLEEWGTNAGKRTTADGDPGGGVPRR